MVCSHKGQSQALLWASLILFFLSWFQPLGGPIKTIPVRQGEKVILFRSLILFRSVLYFLQYCLCFLFCSSTMFRVFLSFLQLRFYLFTDENFITALFCSFSSLLFLTLGILVQLSCGRSGTGAGHRVSSTLARFAFLFLCHFRFTAPPGLYEYNTCSNLNLFS